MLLLSPLLFKLLTVMPLSARKSSVSSQGLSRAYGSPVGPRTSSSGRKKPEWNDRATEDDKYKLTKDELLKKKKMYVSKHNVFASGNTSLSSTRKKKAPARSPHSLSMRDPLLEMTSLDYLNRGELSSEESDAVGDEEQSEGPMDPPLDETTDLARFLNKKKKSALKSPSSLRPPFSEKAQTPQAQRRRAADIEQGNTPKAAGATPVKREAPVTACKRVETSVGTDVLEMLRALYGELSYYEELSGRRSIFDFSVRLITFMLQVSIPSQSVLFSGVEYDIGYIYGSGRGWYKLTSQTCLHRRSCALSHSTGVSH